MNTSRTLPHPHSTYRTAGIVVAVLSTLALAGCSTISVESRATSPAGAPGFTRTLVVVIPVRHDEPNSFLDRPLLYGEKARRECERALVGQLGALHAFASSAALPSSWVEEPPTDDDLVDFANENGADGLVAMWLDALSEKTFEGTSGGSYVHYAGGPDREETVIYTPDTPPTTYVTLNARVVVLSVPDSEIRWTAVVRGLDAYPPRGAAGDLAAAVARNLRRDALLE